MAFQAMVFVELFDENGHRYWFGDVQVSTDEFPTMADFGPLVEDQLRERWTGVDYESLAEYFDRGSSRMELQLLGVWQT